MDQDRGAQNLHFTIESVGNPEGPLAYFLLYLFVIRLSVIRCQVNSIILLVGESQLLLLKSTVGEWNLQSFKWAVVGQVKSFPSSKTPGSVRGDGMPSTTSARRLFIMDGDGRCRCFGACFPCCHFNHTTFLWKSLPLGSSSTKKWLYITIVVGRGDTLWLFNIAMEMAHL